jgi:hypothetical protein
MSNEKSTEIPTISALDPDAVNQGWEGIMKVYGSGFDNGSFVLINGAAPRTTYKSSNLLEAQLNIEITGDVGDKEVKVHTSAGEVSDSRTLTVKAQQTTAPTEATGWGKVKVLSYYVTAISDTTQHSRREIKMLKVEPVAGDAIVGVTLIFVEDNPLTDLGSYNSNSKWVLARTMHRDFDNMYEILKTEKAAYFTWGTGDQNKLTWFAITTDERP